MITVKIKGIKYEIIHSDNKIYAIRQEPYLHFEFCKGLWEFLGIPEIKSTIRRSNERTNNH